jgi:hypothetical protein
MSMFVLGYNPLDHVEGQPDHGYLSITEGSSLGKSSDMIRIMKEKSQDGKFSLYLHTDDPSRSSWHTDASRLGPEFTTTGYVHTSTELTDGDVEVKAKIIPFLSLAHGRIGDRQNCLAPGQCAAHDP